MKNRIGERTVVVIDIFFLNAEAAKSTNEFPISITPSQNQNPVKHRLPMQ